MYSIRILYTVYYVLCTTYHTLHVIIHMPYSIYHIPIYYILHTIYCRRVLVSEVRCCESGKRSRSKPNPDPNPDPDPPPNRNPEPKPRASVTWVACEHSFFESTHRGAYLQPFASTPCPSTPCPASARHGPVSRADGPRARAPVHRGGWVRARPPF